MKRILQLSTLSQGTVEGVKSSAQTFLAADLTRKKKHPIVRERRQGGSNSDCVGRPQYDGWISFQEKRH